VPAKLRYFLNAVDNNKKNRNFAGKGMNKSL